MEHNHQSTSGMNPITAICVAIGVAMLMVLTTFTIFINSSAYTTVKQIEAGTDFARSIKMDGYDTKGPIKAENIEVYQDSVNKRLMAIDDSADFGSQSVSDVNLGLR